MFLFFFSSTNSKVNHRYLFFRYATYDGNSWYWNLLELGHAPSDSWTIWDEVIVKEHEDFEQRRVADSEFGRNEPPILKRVRKFEEMMFNKEVINKNDYNRFGVPANS